MSAQNIMRAAIGGRWAVASIFLANGFLTGSWAPQIPVLLTRLDISKFTLGLLILLFGVGAVMAMTWCGHLISRYGSRTVLRWFGLCGSLGLLVVALAPNVPLAAVAMFIFGGSIGGMDVAMNANGIALHVVDKDRFAAMFRFDLQLDQRRHAVFVDEIFERLRLFLKMERFSALVLDGDRNAALMTQAFQFAFRARFDGTGGETIRHVFPPLGTVCAGSWGACWVG